MSTSGYTTFNLKITVFFLLCVLSIRAVSPQEPFLKNNILLHLTFENEKEFDDYELEMNGSIEHEKGGISGSGIAFIEEGQELAVPREKCFIPSEGSVLFWIKPLRDLSKMSAETIPILFDTVGEGRYYQSYSLKFSPQYKNLMFVIAEKQGSTVILPSELKLSDMETGKWYHICATWKNVNSGSADAAISLYINGKHHGTMKNQSINNLNNLSQKIFFGSGDPTGAYKNHQSQCMYDEIIILKNAISQAELSAYLKASAPEGWTADKKKRRCN